VSVGDKVRTGWEVTFGKDKTTLIIGDVVINFDIVIDTSKGWLFAAQLEFKRPALKTSLTQAPTIKPKPDMNIKRAHALLGHASETITRQICKTLGWTLGRGSLGVCEPCAMDKAEQKIFQVIHSHTTIRTNPSKLHSWINIWLRTHLLERDQLLFGRSLCLIMQLSSLTSSSIINNNDINSGNKNKPLQSIEE
jgi:hypothetical protein